MGQVRATGHHERTRSESRRKKTFMPRHRKKFNIIIAYNVPDLGGRCLSIKRKHLEDQMDKYKKVNSPRHITVKILNI